MPSDRELERLVVRVTADTVDYKRKMRGVSSQAGATSKTIGGIWASMSSKILGPLNTMERNTIVTFNKIKRSTKSTNTAFGRFLNMAARSTNAMRRMGLAATILGGSLSAISLPAGAFAVSSVKSFAEFDKAMTESTAIMGDMSKEMRKELEMTAKTLSLESTATATELARAYYDLASVGYEAEQAQKALGIVARFSAAANISMEKATDKLANAQVALGKKSDDPIKNMQEMLKISDALVTANNLAAGTAEDFAEALVTKTGGAMRVLNMSLEEGVAILMAYHQQGVTAELAGERFYQVTRDLQRAATANADQFKKYGIQVYDLGGNFRSVSNILGDFERAFKGTTDAQRQEIFKNLGMQDRSLAATLQLLGMSSEIRKYTEDIKNAGGATEEVAKKQLLALSTQLDITRKAWELIKIEIGEQFAPMLLRVNEMLRDGLVWWRGLTDEQKKLAAQILAIATVLPTVIVLFGIMAMSMSAIFDAAASAVAGSKWLYKWFGNLNLRAKSVIDTMESPGTTFKEWTSTLGNVADAAKRAATETLLLEQATTRFAGAPGAAGRIGEPAASGLSTAFWVNPKRKITGTPPKGITNAVDEIVDVDFTKKTVGLLGFSAAVDTLSNRLSGTGQKRITGPIDDVIDVDFTKKSFGLLGFAGAVDKTNTKLGVIPRIIKAISTAFIGLSISATIAWTAATAGAALVIGALIAAGYAVWKFRDQIWEALGPELQNNILQIVDDVKYLAGEFLALARGSMAQMWKEVKNNLVPNLLILGEKIRELIMLVGKESLYLVFILAIAAVKAFTYIIKGMAFWLEHTVIPSLSRFIEKVAWVVSFVRGMWEETKGSNPGFQELIDDGYKMARAYEEAAKAATEAVEATEVKSGKSNLLERTKAVEESLDAIEDKGVDIQYLFSPEGIAAEKESKIRQQVIDEEERKKRKNEIRRELGYIKDDPAAGSMEEWMETVKKVEERHRKQMLDIDAQRELGIYKEPKKKKEKPAPGSFEEYQARRDALIESQRRKNLDAELKQQLGIPTGRRRRRVPTRRVVPLGSYRPGSTTPLGFSGYQSSYTGYGGYAGGFGGGIPMGGYQGASTSAPSRMYMSSTASPLRRKTTLYNMDKKGLGGFTPRDFAPTKNRLTSPLRRKVPIASAHLLPPSLSDHSARTKKPVSVTLTGPSGQKVTPTRSATAEMRTVQRTENKTDNQYLAEIAANTSSLRKAEAVYPANF